MLLLLLLLSNTVFPALRCKRLVEWIWLRGEPPARRRRKNWEQQCCKGLLKVVVKFGTQSESLKLSQYGLASDLRKVWSKPWAHLLLLKYSIHVLCTA